MILLPKDAPGALAEAVRWLGSGRLVALPTETVYGLAADATQGTAVAAIYAAKGRPNFNPLIIHTHSIESALALVTANDAARTLAAAFWPGPLTIILPKAEGCPVTSLATAGLETIGIRVPRNALTQAVLKALGRPVAAPSANLSGHVSPTRAVHVAADFANHDVLVLDDGAAEIGLESTIVDLTGYAPVLLRPGAILHEDLERALGVPVVTANKLGHDGNTINAPGQLASHYAPRARVRLGATSVLPGEALLAFGTVSFSHDPARTMNLSFEGDLIAAAAALFDGLRALDALSPRAIAVMPIPDVGLGRAINDRLQRAAAGRAESARS